MGQTGHAEFIGLILDTGHYFKKVRKLFFKYYKKISLQCRSIDSSPVNYVFQFSLFMSDNEWCNISQT